MESSSSRKPIKHPYAFDPCYLLIHFGFYLASAIIQNQILLQECLISGYDLSVCSNLHATNETKQIEIEIQPRASEVNSAIIMLNSFFPPICSLLLGSWSDIYGRKPIMMMSFIGYSMTLILFAIFAYISDYVVTLSPWVYFIAEIPISILGGWPLLDVAASCFVTDVSDKSKHSTRLGTLSALNMTMGFLANFSSSYLHAATSSTTVFTISFVCCLFGLLIVIFVVEESIDNQIEANLISKVCAVFSMKCILDIWRTLWKGHGKFRKRILWSLMSIVVLLVFTIQGTHAVLYLSGRTRFGWELRDFTIFYSVRTGILALGIATALTITKHVFKLSDINLGLIALTSGTIEGIIDAFATETYHMYIGAILGSLHILAIPVFKSVMSNTFQKQEIAKIFSACTALEAFSGVGAGPLYKTTYIATISTFPGAFCFITAGVFGFSFILTFFIIKWQKRTTKESQIEIIDKY